jgi:hypothetical protein
MSGHDDAAGHGIGRVRPEILTNERDQQIDPIRAARGGEDAIGPW